jgi:hypothetical protein
MDAAVEDLANRIVIAAKQHGYQAAFAGELNYSLTRLLQDLPRALVKHGVTKEELRYWTQPLMYGVLLDVILEHKRRINVAYEAHQIIKSGDCYDAPYFTRLVEVVNNDGEHVGYQEVMLKRGENEQPDVIGKLRLKSHFGTFPLKTKKRKKSLKSLPKTKKRKKK